MNSTKCHLLFFLPSNLLTHLKDLRVYAIATFQQIIVLEVNVAGLPLSDPPILAFHRHTPETEPEPEIQFSKFTISFKWRPGVRSI